MRHDPAPVEFRPIHPKRKKLPMSFTKLIAVACVLSMFAVAAEARPRHHHHHHHHHHHKHHRVAHHK